MQTQEIRARLTLAVTTYDNKQSTRRGFNPYALGQYLARVDDIIADIERGADPRAAVVAGFTGSLQAACLRGLRLHAASDAEWTGAGRLCYVPASGE